MEPITKQSITNDEQSLHSLTFPLSPAVLNVAAGKAPMQSSVAEGGIPQKAVDGSSATAFSTDTCTLTNTERNPWWYVNLLEPYMVQLVRLDFGQSCCGTSFPAVLVGEGCRFGTYVFVHKTC